MTVFESMAGRTIAAIARRVAARRLELAVDGLGHVPLSGPVLLVARHHHHLYDGVALLAAVPRRLHLFVALDWARTGPERALLEWAVRSARWPACLRDDALTPRADGSLPGGPSAYRLEESTRYRMGAVRTAVDLLAGGAAVVVFPEAYPNVDPRWTPKTTPDEMLPFRPGFAVIRDLVRRRAHVEVPIVPVGISYVAGERWQARLRIERPLPPGAPVRQLVEIAERRVAVLSGRPSVRDASYVGHGAPASRLEARR